MFSIHFCGSVESDHKCFIFTIVCGVPTLLQPFNEFVSKTRKNNDRTAIKNSTLPSQLLSASFFYAPSCLFYLLQLLSSSSFLLLHRHTSVFPRRKFPLLTIRATHMKGPTKKKTITWAGKSQTVKIKTNEICLCLISRFFHFLAFLSVDNHINGLVMFA